MEEPRNAHKILVRKSQEKVVVRRSMRIWEIIIGFNIREIRCETMEQIELAHDSIQWPAFVNTVMNLKVS
jgi:hypothetical protein